MASLKEIKGRIGSVNTTLKITSAMKMVASAKLHKAQREINKALPYEESMRSILSDLISAGEAVKGGLFEERPVGKVALVCFSSNSSLCGSFNSNMIKKADEVIAEYRKAGVDDITIFSIGKKMDEAMAKRGFSSPEICSSLSLGRTYNDSVSFAKELSESFLSGKYDLIELIYPHFKSISSQPVVREVFLPFGERKPAAIATGFHTGGAEEGTELEYILEPDKAELMSRLVPQYLNHKIYSVLLDSAAAEFAARTVAMQTATENGEDLLQELTLEYNKERQQKITDEILDIVGGSAR